MLVERLLDLGTFDIHYLARRIDPQVPVEGYSLHQIPAHKAISGTFAFDGPGLMRLLEQLRPDIVYQRVGCTYSGVAARYAHENKRRMVWHVSSDRDLTPLPWRWSWRSPLEQLNRSMVRYAAHHADVVVVQNAEQSALLGRHYGRTDALRIPNFHPAPDFPFAKADGRIVVCWIANIKALKRLDMFLRLASDFQERRDVDFVVAGAPQMKLQDWEHLRAEMHRLRNVRYLGTLSHDAVNDLLASAHVLVNTSTVEGFPNTFIQAWLREVPVVSMCINPDHVFDADRYGICADEDYETLRGGLQRMIIDAGLRQQIGARARLFARERFSEKNIDRLVRLLEP